MIKEGRSVEPRCSSRQARQRPDVEPRSKGLREALASASAFISHLPQSFRRLSSSLRATSRTSDRSSTAPLQPSNMSNLSSGSAVAASSVLPGTVLHGRLSQSHPPIGGGSSTPHPAESKENIPPSEIPPPPLSRLSLEQPPIPKNLAIQPPNPPGRTEEERRAHQHFTNEALEMARLALRTNETPVGCVLVHNGTIIAKGMNATNITRNGTRHAEFMALVSLFARSKKGREDAKTAGGNDQQAPNTGTLEEDENPAAHGHLYPYGQKLHPADIVDKSIVKECVLYVTVEPCVMCASLLRQLGIKKVFFGAVNDKFGGTGGVFNIHKNVNPLDGACDMSRGDGGNVEPGYEVEGGWGRDDAVGLLRRFYVQENGRAPVPRKKEGRAARLAALERDASGDASLTSTVPEAGETATASDSTAGDGESRADEGQPKVKEAVAVESQSCEWESRPDGRQVGEGLVDIRSSKPVNQKNQADKEGPILHGQVSGGGSLDSPGVTKPDK